MRSSASETRGARVLRKARDTRRASGAREQSGARRTRFSAANGAARRVRSELAGGIAPAITTWKHVRDQRRGEEGITLSELLIAIVITGVIMVPIGDAIFVGLHTSGATQDRIQESVGTNLFSSYFGPDVHNTVSVHPDTVEPAGVCPSPVVVDLLLITETGQSSISYYRGSGLGDTVLYRRTCVGGVASVPARLFRKVSTDPAERPVFTCTPSPCSTTWTSVNATVIQSDPNNPDYTITARATRRIT